MAGGLDSFSPQPNTCSVKFWELKGQSAAWRAMPPRPHPEHAPQLQTPTSPPALCCCPQGRAPCQGVQPARQVPASPLRLPTYVLCTGFLLLRPAYIVPVSSEPPACRLSAEEPGDPGPPAPGHSGQQPAAPGSARCAQGAQGPCQPGGHLLQGRLLLSSEPLARGQGSPRSGAPQPLLAGPGLSGCSSLGHGRCRRAAKLPRQPAALMQLLQAAPPGAPCKCAPSG